MVDAAVTDTSHQANPALAVDRWGIIHVVWEDYRDNPLMGNIYYAKSTDGGETFGKDVMVDVSMTDTSEQKSPSVAVYDDGTVHVVWEDYRDHPRLGNIYYSSSTDGGESFGEDVMVDDMITATSHQRTPMVAVGASAVHVAWEDYRDHPDHGSVYHCMSTDGGRTFSADVMVPGAATLASSQVRPALAVDERGIVHVIWQDYRRIGDRATSSGPGESLWTDTFGPGEYTVRKIPGGPEDWYDPLSGAYHPGNHRDAYQYNFCMERDPFVQERGKTYWLAIDAVAP